MYDFNEVRANHFVKRCQQLEEMSKTREMISFLNTALLDKDIEKIDTFSELLRKQGKHWETNNVSDNIRNKNRLKIVYLLPHSGITGGMKILIEQSNYLAAKGHDVLLYSHSPKPDWIECKSPYYLVHPENNIYHMTPTADVVIAGYWDLVVDALQVKAPLKYHFAQGDYDIFKFNQLDENQKQVIDTAYTLPVKILTVSNIMIKKLNENFGRNAVLIPNAIDTKIFHAKKDISINKESLNILLVGSDSIDFKNHNVIIEALCKLKSMGYQFKLKWLTQNKLINDYSKKNLEVEEYIAPTQKQIGNIYRDSDIYICASLYESFALPVIEAMACGTCVITSDNGGIDDYAKDNINCLVFQRKNIDELIEKIQALFDNPELRVILAENGLKTAKKYTWAKSVNLLEKELLSAAENTIQGFYTD